MGILYLVIPCYNEEAVIEHTVEELHPFWQIWSGNQKLPLKAGFCWWMMVVRIPPGRKLKRCIGKILLYAA